MVEGPTRKFVTGQRTLGEVRDGSVNYPEVRDGSVDSRGGPGRVADPPGSS